MQRGWRPAVDTRRHRRWGTVAIATIATAAMALSACANGRTAPATDVGPTTATLHGSYSSDRDEDARWWFEYGTSTAYGTSTTHHPVTLSDRDQHPVSEAVSGLQSDTAYHFRLCVRSPFLTHCGADESFTTQPAPEPTELAITAEPALYPSFDPQISDYVTRCGADPVRVNVAAPAATTVAVDGQPGRTGRFSESVPLSAGQRFTFSATSGGQTDSFHVRCLPASFPDWTFSRTGTPTQAWTLTTVGLGFSGIGYVAVFDGRGTPVWWYRPEGVAPIDGKLLGDDSIAFAEWPGGPFTAGGAFKYQVRRWTGRSCAPCGRWVRRPTSTTSSSCPTATSCSCRMPLATTST